MPNESELQFLQKRDWNERREYLVIIRKSGDLAGVAFRNGRTWTACHGNRTTYGIPSLAAAGRVLAGVNERQ